MKNSGPIKSGLLPVQKIWYIVLTYLQSKWNTLKKRSISQDYISKHPLVLSFYN